LNQNTHLKQFTVIEQLDQKILDMLILAMLILAMLILAILIPGSVAHELGCPETSAVGNIGCRKHRPSET
jgi:hypothetical protein